MGTTDEQDKKMAVAVELRQPVWKPTPEMQAVLEETASWARDASAAGLPLCETITAVLEDTRKSFLGVPQKEPLFDFYVDTLLPLVGRKAPSVWLVLIPPPEGPGGSRFLQD